MDYLVVIEGDSVSGYSAYLPELPGCVTVGDSIEETKALMQEAVEFHLEGLREDMGVTTANQLQIRPNLRFEMAQSPQAVRDISAEYRADDPCSRGSEEPGQVTH